MKIFIALILSIACVAPAFAQLITAKKGETMMVYNQSIVPGIPDGYAVTAKQDKSGMVLLVLGPALDLSETSPKISEQLKAKKLNLEYVKTENVWVLQGRSEEWAKNNLIPFKFRTTLPNDLLEITGLIFSEKNGENLETTRLRLLTLVKSQ